MSRHCIHQVKRVQQVKQAKTVSHWSRSISTSSGLLQEDNGENKKERKKDDSEKETSQGFFARFKSELMKDLESNEQNKQTFEQIQKQSEKFQTQYDKYVGSKFSMFRPPKAITEKIDKFEKPDVSKENLNQRIEAFKSRFQKERLTEDYRNLLETAKEKSESSFDKVKRWREKPEQETQEGEEMLEPSKPNVVSSKFKDLFEKSGIAENAIYKKAKEHTSSVIHENKDIFSGISKAASEVVSKSKEWRETATKQSKIYSEELGKTVEEISKKVDETKEAVEKSKILERSKEALERSERLAKETAERLAREKEEFQKSEKFKKVTEVTQETLKTAAEDFYDPTRLKESETYRSPEQLKKRIEDEELDAMNNKAEEAQNKMKIDEETTGITEHKGFKWETSWKNFKEQNPLVQKLMLIRENLEESDNILARAGYKVFDSFHNLFTGMLQPSEISTTIAEIHKMDPNFDLTVFGTTLRFDIVPNVIEAYLRSDVNILENWCQERALGQFKHMLAAREFTGTMRLIDIGECDILTGCMLDLGPVFMFNVQTQQMYSKSVKSGAGDEVTETSEDVIKLVTYTMAVCRDQTMLDPTAAWTVLEIIEHVTNENFV